jgi:hypothetical protein
LERLERLIDEARVLSQNQKYDADSGVSQDTFVRYFKNAQDIIVREMVNVKSKYLLKEKIYDTVSNQERYSYPHDIYLHNIDTLEYSENSLDYIFLEKVYSKDRKSGFTGYAYGYTTREDGFYVIPTLTGGKKLRLSYIRNPNQPQRRMGKISNITISNGQITAITLDTTDSSFDPTALSKYDFFCIVSRKGEQKVKAVEFTSVNSITGVVTLPAHTLEAGETAAIGDYVCGGKYVTNKIELPDTCESFLILHASYEAKYGDSSQWSNEARNLMSAHLAQLILSFSKNSDDISEVIITNYDYLA